MVTIIKTGVTAIAGEASTLTITFATDTDNETTPAAFPAGYTVVVVGVPDYATSVRVSIAPTVTSVEFTFGTATGTGGANFYWSAIGYKLS